MVNKLMVRLSIIIPVYNVERYIGKCLESCYAQDIDTTEYEIIIVDDSSPDNSINIVREYQSIYDNIKLSDGRMEDYQPQETLG